MGRKLAYQLAKTCTQAGYTIVSGLAKGCDTQAHLGCVENNGITIAVLAHGLHRIYPSQNRNLAQKIIDQNGILLSEYPIGIEPTKYAFVSRNRWQSALSDKVVVIETTMNGGAMHTLSFASKSNKPIGCVYLHNPKWLKTPQASGNQYLITNKKGILLDSKDSLQNFIIDW